MRKPSSLTIINDDGNEGVLTGDAATISYSGQQYKDANHAPEMPNLEENRRMYQPVSLMRKHNRPISKSEHSLHVRPILS